MERPGRDERARWGATGPRVRRGRICPPRPGKQPPRIAKPRRRRARLSPLVWRRQTEPRPVPEVIVDLAKVSRVSTILRRRKRRTIARPPRYALRWALRPSRSLPSRSRTSPESAARLRTSRTMNERPARCLRPGPSFIPLRRETTLTNRRVRTAPTCSTNKVTRHPPALLRTRPHQGPMCQRGRASALHRQPHPRRADTALRAEAPVARAVGHERVE